MRRAPPVHLSADEREELVALVQGRTTPQRVAFRARIVLGAADRRQNRQIAGELGTTARTVALWRQRFLAHRTPGILRDAPRPGRPTRLSDETVERIVRTAREGRAPSGAFWSIRTLASALGVSRSTVQRVWALHHLSRVDRSRPRAVEGTGFIDRVSDFVGLYVDPPERALAFLVEERPDPSPGPGAPDRRAASGPSRDRSVAFLTFLRSLERESPSDQDLHLVVDQLWTSGAPSVQRWLARHPRVILHVVPAGRAGPNLLDRWVGALSEKRIGPGSPPSVIRLHRAFQAHAGSRRPFVWTATAAEIRRRARRAPSNVLTYGSSTPPSGRSPSEEDGRSPTAVRAARRQPV